MKSPISSVGIIDPDGILNGSTRKERSRNTIRITGKKLIEYSTHQGCLSSFRLFFLSTNLSSSQTSPVTSSSSSRKPAKPKVAMAKLFILGIAPLQHREERFLRDL